MRANDRRSYAAKFMPVVPRGEQARELLAGQLAGLVSAPAPGSAVLELTQMMLDEEPRLAFKDGSRPTVGLAAGTRYQAEFDEPPMEWGSRLGLVADADLAGIVAFDTWLGNSDRHPDNYVFHWETGDIRLASVDFALSMRGTAGTKPSVVDPADIAAVLKRDWQAVDAAVRVIEAVADSQIASAIEAVPDDWLDPAQREQIAAYLAFSRDELRNVLKEAANG